MNTVITFEDFNPGAVMGESVEVFDEMLAQRWQKIFGDHSADGANVAAEGASLAVVMMMRAYLNVVAPRPPGNVHARQRFSLESTPRQGEAIRTVIACIEKEFKRERRYVELQAWGTGEGGRSIFSGRMTLIWAA
jgi:hypothetical protein